MAIAALITWLITATGGFVMLANWISKGGHRPSSDSRLAPGLVFVHFGLAAVGLVLWIVYLIVGGAGLAWTAFILLLPVALLGFTMFGRWIASRRTSAVESHFPVLVVAGHGLFAVATVVLVLLSALNA